VRDLELGVPSSPEAEQALLGCILLDNSVLDSVIPRLSPAAFYQRKNGIIYEGMVQLNADKTPIDCISIRDVLDVDLDKLGGVAYLAQCQTETPSALNWESYCKLIEDKHRLRTVLHHTYSVQQIIESGCSDDEALEGIEKTLTELALKNTSGDFVSMKSALQKTMRTMEQAHEGGGPAGVQTGFVKLDSLTTGLRKGSMIVLAARPSMGKTTLAINIATNVAESGTPVGVFSLEMTDEELAHRIVCSKSLVNGRSVMAGELTKSEWGRVITAYGSTRDLPIFYETKGGITAGELRSKARQMKVKHDVGLIVVDYLGLMRGNGNSLYEQVTESSKAIKQIAMELDIPVLILSQLNREADNDGSLRLSMLRDSGSVEQDADMVWMLNRPDSSSNIMELMVMKNRQGPTATVKLEFAAENYRFQNPRLEPTYGMDE